MVDFSFRLGTLERVFPVYAQSVLDQSWVLGVVVSADLFVDRTLNVKMR